MIAAFKLAARVLSLELPPRVVLWALLSKTNRMLGTGNRRFELERMYWSTPSSYERQKYERTLAACWTGECRSGSCAA
jgi:hypothetical protein